MTVDLPKTCVLLNQIHIVEYLDNNGELVKFGVFEDDAGMDTPLDRVLLLLEWARAKATASMYASLVAEAMCDSDDEDYEDDESR